MHFYLFESMDDNGITVQVLSFDSSGSNLLSPEEGPAFEEHLAKIAHVNADKLLNLKI